MGRGCSTKDKVFYKECETHSYGDSLEKMCFCSFQLCNAGVIQLNCPSPWTLILLTLTLSTVFASSFCCWTNFQIWDPWPPCLSTSSNVFFGNKPRRPCRGPDKYSDRPPQLLLQIDIMDNSDKQKNTSTENKPPLSEKG